MSKGAIGGFAGGIIGFVVSGFNPTGFQVGFMLGSAIGSSFDTVPGRKVGELTSPQAREGEPMPLVFGTGVVAGRLMSYGGYHVKKEGGKGGPQVENETAYLTYSILICESSELRSSSVAGIVLVRQNNKIVYDMRPDPAISYAESAKWLENKKFYFGGEDQGVDPTEQMIHGAGNVPAYRGIARMVVDDEDITQHGGAVPTYEFVVSACPLELRKGTVLVTGAGIGDGSPFAMAKAEPHPVFEALTGVAGADLTAGLPAGYRGAFVVIGSGSARRSTDPLSAWEMIGTPAAGAMSAISITGGPSGFVVAQSGVSHDALRLDNASSAFSTLTFTTQRGTSSYPNSTFKKWVRYDGGRYWGGDQNGPIWTVTAENLSGPYFASTTPYDNGTADIRLTDTVFHDGYLYAIFNVGVSEADGICRTPYGGSIPAGGYAWSVVLDPQLVTTLRPVRLSAGGNGVVAYAAGGTHAWTSADGFAEPHLTGLASSTVDVPITYSDGLFFLISSTQCVTTEDGINFNPPVELPIYSARGIASSGAEFYAGAAIPDAPGHFIDRWSGQTSGPSQGVATMCGTTLRWIVDTLDDRSGVPLENRDSSDLEGIEVAGYVIDQFVTVSEAKEPLRGVYCFDCAEYDDAIRYRRRGKATDFIIDPDDLIVGDDATERSKRGQTVEYPRRLHIQYTDPALGYKQMKQTAVRNSPDVRVKGEVVLSTRLTLDADTAKQAAEVCMKIEWAEREDTGQEIAVPMEYWARTIPGHTYSLRGKRRRIVEVKLEAGSIGLKSVYDRQSAYFSDAVGLIGPSPTGPGSSLRGPTIAAVMNTPVLRDDDDKPGLYWAACGYPKTAWAGARLQVQRGTEWVTLGDITTACNIGELLAPLPTGNKWSVDKLHPLQVKMPQSLDSVSASDWLNERNGLAILKPDHRIEALQFQTATETTPNEYSCRPLIRGALDTTPIDHAAGATVVALNNNLRFVQLRKDDLGQTLTLRVFSLGTNPDLAEPFTITLATLESQREWQPWNVAVEITETCEHRVTFVGRHRLGTDLNPVASQWFKGWRIDFTLNGVTHSRMTQEESFLYTREMQVEDWGVALCAAYDVAVYAVNEYTGTDGAGNPPANDDEPFLVSGNIPDGYVGSAYRIFSGDAGFVLTGKSQVTYNDAFGLVGAGVTAHGPEPYSVGFVTRGTPLAAGTYTTDINAGNAGEIAQSVTFAAKPTYTLLDMRWRGWSEGRWADTTPPLTTQVYEADQRSGTGSMWTLAALGSGDADAHVEFVVTGADVYIGINARMPAELTDAAFFAGIVYAAPDTVAYLAAAGTYAIELAPSTGAWAIIKLGTGTVASGTLPLPSGNRYRFGYTVPLPQDSTVAFNGGNSAWAITPTGSHAGVAHPSVVVPVGWLDTSPANGVTFGTFGKSSGQWRVQVGGRYRSGLAMAGFDEANGFPGDPGADDSIVFDGATLRWTFGGTANFIDLPWPPSAEPAPIYAIDFAASTVKVCRVDYTTGVVSVIHTITGLPAGTWLPFDFRGYLSKQIKHNPAGPAGYSDWTNTL